MNEIIKSVLVLVFIVNLAESRTFNVRETEVLSNQIGHRYQERLQKRSDVKYYVCEIFCNGESGTYKRCRYNYTMYFECLGESSCNTKSCASDQIFNTDTLSCEPCPAGYHKDPYGRKCVCNEGTQMDWDLMQCLPCPTGSTIYNAEHCFCPFDQQHDVERNICRECSADSEQYSLKYKICGCNNASLFWSNKNFACQECPGILVENQSKLWGADKYFCQCQGENEIFNKWTATCLRCPANSYLDIIPGLYQFCVCPNMANGEIYSERLGTCRMMD